MKVRVRVELLDPEEAEAANEIEQELREVLGHCAADIAVSRGASAALPRVVEVLRGGSGDSRQVDERLSGIEARELGWAFGFISCGTDVALRKMALAHAGKLPDGDRRRAVGSVMMEHIVSVFANVAVQPARSELRRAAAAMVEAIDYRLLTVSSVAQCCLTLFRVPETVVPGSILLAVLISCHSESLIKLPEATELRKLVAQHQQLLPGYEAVYIAEGMRWAPPVVTKNVTLAGRHQMTRNVVVTGVTAMTGSVVGCTSDGSLITLDTSAKEAAEVFDLGDVVATSIDASAATRQLAVALTSKDGPSVCLLSEAEGKAAWSQRGSASITELGSKSIATAVRAMKSSAQFCVAVSDTSRSVVALLDSATSKTSSVFRFHTDVITTLHVPASRETLVMSGSRDKTVVLFDVRSNTKVATMAVHSQTVTAVSSEGDVVIAAGLDGKVAVCDIRNLSQPVGRRTFDSGVLRAALGPSHICAVATHGALYLLSLHSSEMPIARVETYGAPCADLAWIPGRGMACVAAGPNVDLFSCEAPTTPSP